MGPCFAKKIEAQQTGEIDTALTFQELQEVLNYTKTNNISTTQQTIDSDFDSFYNDYTKVYPLT
ncbi:TPA: hypothetical protein DEP21_00345 [Patescibacteria group bacterium]|nr:hypothetical protein [Candidatus Gracilibacteria bacterium]